MADARLAKPDQRAEVVGGDDSGRSADEVERRLRTAQLPVIATTRDGKVWLDVRTIGEDELPAVALAVQALGARLA